MSTNLAEHYEFVNRCFAHWNDKNGRYSKRAVIENLGFYAAIQEHRGFADAALKLQACLLKLYRKKRVDFEDDCAENADTGAENRVPKKSKSNQNSAAAPPEIDLDL
jgi:hypothetical protein